VFTARCELNNLAFKSDLPWLRRLGLVHTLRFSTNRELAGRARAQLVTLIISPVLTGRSNDQERCYQAVVHSQRSAMDRNSVIAVFLLYRRERRRDRFHWVHPVIQKEEEFGAFYTLFDKLRGDAD